MRLFSPKGLAPRQTFIFVVVFVAIGQGFVVVGLSDFAPRLSPEDFYLLVGGASLPLAWIQICAMMKRLQDAGWSAGAALPAIPVCFWPLWPPFHQALPAALNPLFAALSLYAILLFALLSGKKSAQAPLLRPATPPVPSVPVNRQPEPREAPPLQAPPGPTLVMRPWTSRPAPSATQVDRRSSTSTVVNPPRPLTPPLSAPPQAASPEPVPSHSRSPFPAGFDPVVGWLVVIDGQSAGEQYRLRSHRNRIGSAPWMDVRITAPGIESDEHASVSYDLVNDRYSLAPGSGQVSLKDHTGPKPITQPTVLQPYERIDLAGITLIFVPLGPHHHWKPASP